MPTALPLVMQPTTDTANPALTDLNLAIRAYNRMCTHEATVRRTHYRCYKSGRSLTWQGSPNLPANAWVAVAERMLSLAISCIGSLPKGAREFVRARVNDAYSRAGQPGLPASWVDLWK